MSISSVDLRFLVHELTPEIEGSWISNIYHLPNGIFIFKLRLPQEGTRLLLIEPGKRIHLTQFNRKMPKEPTPLCRTLRSHLRDRRINSFEQRYLDRIVEFTVGADDGRKVIIELFGEGNVILIDNKTRKILGALRYRKMRDRDIHPGRIFHHAPPMERDLLRHGVDNLDQYLETHEKLIIALNEWMGLGPYYSRLIVKQAGIKTKVSNELTTEQKEILLEHAKQLYHRIHDFEYQPTVYLDLEVDGDSTSEETLEFDEQWSDDSLAFDPEKVLKIQPWPQAKIEEAELMEVDSLGEALDVFYSSQEDQNALDEEVEEIETEVDRLERRLEQQRQHQENMYREAELNRRNADTLYMYYNDVSELLTTIMGARKNKVSWEEIESKLMVAKEKGMSAAQILSEIRPSQGQVLVELEHDGNTFKLPLDFRKSINELADGFYKRAKKQEKRAEGANIAIEHTKEKIEQAKLDMSNQQTRAEVHVTVLKRRKRWYEKFHWIQAPNGMVIIGGTDANTNETLVKKYMDDDDLFLHADIHGAPFVVIKTEGREASDNVKELAAVLGVCYSSAWKGKRVTADAFVLPPDQVSLSAPSGEYMPKGSIMMYGTKEFIRDIPLELYIGLIIETNWVRLICGPKSTMDKADHWIKIIPGDVQRGKTARRIKDIFARMLDEVDRQKLSAIDTSEIAKFIPDDSKIIEMSTEVSLDEKPQ